MTTLLISNEENFIPSNRDDMPMINGEISPILGDFQGPAQTSQIAIAYVS